ncbi:DUF488 domain-containing protein [Dyella sp. 2HG41-7]|uniref:DUF488 domain-containing protein n=1 Tax=Dyella sp. 2HG41-7 TaxID=2883239 RepID=UPI001F365384|nr:DUF488 domain-containing protein [Dyella sp. 2HG41-7]
MTGIPFYTIGHATRPLAEFVSMLQAEDISMVVDVRTVPRSRTNPQYNADSLPHSLTTFHIGYEHVAALGGLRPKSRSVPQDVNAFWENQSFHNYADYAMSDDFHAGLAHLRELGRRRRCAVMCAETLWWRCHRRIIADYLLAEGQQVFHLMSPGSIEPAKLTVAAHRTDGETLTYPAVESEDEKSEISAPRTER